MNKCLNIKKQTLIIIFISLFMSNCAYHKIEKLQEMPNSTNKFSEELSHAYLKFALSEMNEMHDEIDAAYFADKGINAKLNKKVYPEEVKNWDIANNYIKEANDKRNKILDFHNSKLLKNHPQILAKTQIGFDCWLEQLEEGWQDEHIKDCYEMMNNNLNKMVKIVRNNSDDYNISSKPKITNEEAQQIKEIKEIKKITNIDNKQKFEIYFAHDKFKLDFNLQNKLNDIIKKYAEAENTIFEIIGHTDTSGTKEYNLILSKLRANSVKQFLLKKGLSAYNISTFYYGETKPKIQTKDGIKEPQNRRVEIFINNNNEISQL